MEQIAEELNKIVIERQKTDQLLKLKPLYEFWNKQINVISRKDFEMFYLHHILHSLSIAKTFDFKNNPNVLDLGCGGGFPGIPLAICFPDIHFHLVDSIGKKIKVVNEIVTALELKNVTAEQIRAENICGRYFDCIVSRAVAPLSVLIRWSRPLIDKKNQQAYGLICLKGGDLKNEISQTNKEVEVISIYPEIFADDWFREKFILHVKLRDR